SARRLQETRRHGGDRAGARARPRSRASGRARRRARAPLPVRPGRQGSRPRTPRVSAKALAIYLMAGREAPGLAEAGVEGGADLIELGFPFSDPLADGPVIRRAAERALAEGMRTSACLECLAQTHERLGPAIPLVPMTYASLLEAYGYERFAADARAVG